MLASVYEAAQLADKTHGSIAFFPELLNDMHRDGASADLYASSFLAQRAPDR